MPVSKGSGLLETAELTEAFIVDNALDWPVVIKAAHGGGGRGMRLVHQLSEAWHGLRLGLGLGLGIDWCSSSPRCGMVADVDIEVA